MLLIIQVFFYHLIYLKTYVINKLYIPDIIGVEDKQHYRNIVVNGDGFGLAWYVNEACKGCCCTKFLTPAWSNTNLRNLGNGINQSI